MCIASDSVIVSNHLNKLRLHLTQSKTITQNSSALLVIVRKSKLGSENFHLNKQEELWRFGCKHVHLCQHQANNISILTIYDTKYNDINDKCSSTPKPRLGLLSGFNVAVKF